MRGDSFAEWFYQNRHSVIKFVTLQQGQNGEAPERCRPPLLCANRLVVAIKGDNYDHTDAGVKRM